jgi:hypothetical protein
MCTERKNRSCSQGVGCQLEEGGKRSKCEIQIHPGMHSALDSKAKFSFLTRCWVRLLRRRIMNEVDLDICNPLSARLTCTRKRCFFPRDRLAALGCMFLLGSQE